MYPNPETALKTQLRFAASLRGLSGDSSVAPDNTARSVSGRGGWFVLSVYCCFKGTDGRQMEPATLYLTCKVDLSIPTSCTRTLQTRLGGQAERTLPCLSPTRGVCWEPGSRGGMLLVSLGTAAACTRGVVTHASTCWVELQVELGGRSKGTF